MQRTFRTFPFPAFVVLLVQESVGAGSVVNISAWSDALSEWVPLFSGAADDSRATGEFNPMLSAVSFSSSRFQLGVEWTSDRWIEIDWIQLCGVPATVGAAYRPPALESPTGSSLQLSCPDGPAGQGPCTLDCLVAEGAKWNPSS